METCPVCGTEYQELVEVQGDKLCLWCAYDLGYVRRYDVEDRTDG